MENSSSNKRLVKNTIFLYIRMLLMMGVNLFSSRIVLQVLGVEDFGLYNVVGSIVILFTIINSTLSSGTSRFLTFELGKGNLLRLKNTFSAAFLMHLGIAILIFVVAETIGLWYINDVMVIPQGRMVAANYLYQFSIFSCMLSITQVPYSAIIISHEKMDVYAWLGVAESCFKLLIVYALMYISFNDKLISYGVMILLWSCIIQLFLRYYCIKHFEESKLTLVKDKSYYKEMLSFSMWDAIGAFCVNGNSQGLNLLTNLFFGVVVNAARGIAFQVENAIAQFSSNFITAVRPQIVKLFAEGKIEKFLALVFTSSRYSYYLLFLVSLPVFLECKYLLSIWLVEVPDYTIVFLQYVIFTKLIRSFNTPVVHAVHATGNIKYINIYSGSVSVLLQIPLTYVLYKLGYPPQSTFWVITIAYFVCNFIELLCLKKMVNFKILYFIKHIYIKGIMVSIISSIIPILIVNSFNTSFLRMLFVSFSTILSLSVSVYFFDLDEINKEKVLGYIKKKIMK